MLLPRHFLYAALCLAACVAQAQAGPPATLVGKTEHGVAVDLDKYRGKVVMLYFWSTECPVCLDQLPEMRRNLKGWRGKDFLVLAVNQDRAMSDLNAYEKVLDKVAPPNPQMEIVWRRGPAYHDSFDAFPINSPVTFVIDRTGNVVKRVAGRAAPELWDDIADLVLNCTICQ